MATHNAKRLSEAVRTLPRARYSIPPKHDLRLYADLIEDTTADRIFVNADMLGRGTDSLVFERSPPQLGEVVKITWRKLPERAGKRSFDVPIIDEPIELGVAGKNTRILIIRQPKVEIGCSAVEMEEFFRRLEKDGKRITDSLKDRPEQVGKYRGEVRLVDLFAVV